MRLTLLPKMILCILVPALLGLCVVAGFSYYAAEKTMSRQLAEEMTLVIERQKSELNNNVLPLQDILQNATNVARVQRLLREKAAGAPAEHIAELLPAAQDAVDELKKNFPLFRATALVAADGTILAHSDRKQNNTSRKDRDYFKQAMRGKKATENIISKSTGELTTILSVPAVIDGKILGVVFGDVNIPVLTERTTDTIKLGHTGICFLYNNTGRAIAHPDKKYIGTDNSQVEWTRHILAERDGRLAYVWEGKEKIAYFRHIPVLDWFLVLTVERDDMLSGVTAMLRANLWLVGVCSLAVGLIIFLMARNFARVLKGEAGFVAYVAEGNLTIPPDMRKLLAKDCARSDEIGMLARGIRHMVDRIRALFDEAKQKTDEAEQATAEARRAMDEAEDARKAAENARKDGMLAAAGRLESMAGIISSASTELSAQIEQSDRGAAESAQRLSEAATAMNEMNATVQEVAKNAGSASAASADTKQKAEAGSQVVEKAVQSIGQVHQMSLTLKEDMAQLNEHAQDITRIMGVISDIADQTNLLALNAAIEAARAGEAGRGFAVVADEVRKLAEKTMASTNDVGNAIRSIQESTAKSMEGVEQSVERISEATELAGQSGAALEEIVATVEATGDQVNAIATASEEQSAASEEINHSIVQVNDMAKQTADAMAEAAKAVSDLAAQAQGLTNLIQELKAA